MHVWLAPAQPASRLKHTLAGSSRERAFLFNELCAATVFSLLYVATSYGTAFY